MLPIAAGRRVDDDLMSGVSFNEERKKNGIKQVHLYSTYACKIMHHRFLRGYTEVGE